MKRWALGLGLAVLLAAFAFPAFGWGPGWGHMYYGGGPGYCWQGNGNYGPGAYGNITPEQRDQLNQLQQSFYNDTANLRNELWNKTGELNSLMNAPNPDEQQVQKLQKQISDLRAQLDEKRTNFEIQARKIAPDAGYAYGYGRGFGPRMGRGYGYGPGHCWNY